MSISSLHQAKKEIEKTEKTEKGQKGKEIKNRAEKIRNEINNREGSDKNKKLFKKINQKLQDKTFIAQAIESVSTHDSHEDRKPDEEGHSFDENKGGQGDRGTDKMGEINK